MFQVSHAASRLSLWAGQCCRVDDLHDLPSPLFQVTTLLNDFNKAASTPKPSAEKLEALKVSEKQTAPGSNVWSSF
jgi:hypothetical protein